MKKEKLIKNCIALAVALVLIIVAAVFMAKPSTAYAGAGKGSNAKIKSVEEFSEMLQNVSARLANNGTATVSAREADGGAAYKSVTVIEHTDVTASSSYSYETPQNNGSYTSYYTTKRDNSMTMQRDLTTYVGENAVYYDSQGILSSSYRYERTGNESAFRKGSTDLQFHMYLYVDQNNAFMYFKQFAVSSTYYDRDETDKEKEERIENPPYNFDCILNRWINLSGDSDYGAEDLVSEMISLNRQNMEILNLIGEYTQDYEDSFSRSGNTYKMGKEKFQRFANSVLSISGASSSFDTDFAGSLTVSLANSASPKVTVNLKNSDKDSDNFSIKAAETDEFRFENINNTVVKDIPNLVDAITAKEFVERIVGEV